jgi:hypothetical protein
MPANRIDVRTGRPFSAAELLVAFNAAARLFTAPYAVRRPRAAVWLFGRRDGYAQGCFFFLSAQNVVVDRFCTGAPPGRKNKQRLCIS